jgi:TolA-binding protein
MEEENYNPCVDVFIEMIKEAEPDMSRQMKSHYKKQFIKMSDDEDKQNLVYKLCLKMWEMEDEIKSYEGDVERLRECNRELKMENRVLKGKSQKI